jgi:hypothetical protein
MHGETTSTSLESLRTTILDHLERTEARLNEEIRRYPTPIAGCDEQLTDLLERRSWVVSERRRMEAHAETELSREEQITLIEAFVTLPGHAGDEEEARLKAHVAAALREQLE